MISSPFRILLLLGCVLATATVPARALELPPLPLPDCMPPTLPAEDDVECEGTRIGFSMAPPGYVGPSTAGIGLTISTRTVDFRLDADLGAEQLITFTWTLPPVHVEPGPNGATFRSIIRPIWPEGIGQGSPTGAGHSGISCLLANDPQGDFEADCDGLKPPGTTGNTGQPIVRDGPCAKGQASCSYRVNWSPYDQASRTRTAIVLRVGLGFDVGYTRENMDGTFDVCGSDLATSNCVPGAGVSYRAYRVDPPPPLVPVGVANRLGTRKFEFDATDSGPEAQEFQWSLSQVSFSTTSPVFEYDFAQHDLTFGSSALLRVKDRWARTEFKSVPYSFLAPAGTEGPLEIISFEIIGVDENGLATLKAVIKNVSSEDLSGVFLLGSEEFGVKVTTSPDGVELAQGESIEFTVQFQFDHRDDITVTVQAFGTGDDGIVKSAEESREVDSDTPLPSETTVTAPSAAGDDTLQVSSNGGFAAGDYAAVGPGGGALARAHPRGGTEEVRRIKALGSLIFDAPLAYPHAAGEVVQKVSAPSGDTTAPTITVTVPLAGGSVCQNATLAADFTCSDAGVGVEECGGAVSDGQAIDTATLGARQLVVDAWDANGNATSTTVAYDVVFCSDAVDAFRCYGAKPSKGSPKFAPILGVGLKHAFEDLLVDLKKPQLLCAPADPIGDGLLDAETHIEVYAAKPQKGQPKSVAQAGLAFTTQLGTFAVDVAKPDLLGLPTAEDGAAVPPVVATDVDRFACYKAKLAKGEPKLAKTLELTVGDHFTDLPQRFSVKKLARLCVPIGVDGGAAKHAEHLLCFAVAPTKGRCAGAAPLNAGGSCKKEPDCGGVKGQTTHCIAQPKLAKQLGRQVANDLDAGTLDVVKGDVLCLPALPVP